jgi:hypothetical protein
MGGLEEGTPPPFVVACDRATGDEWKKASGSSRPWSLRGTFEGMAMPVRLLCKPQRWEEG